jgi:predicted nucleic acid-binding protein
MMSVRIYLNTSALNRPFDDLSSERVRLEAEAVAAILAAVEAGKVELVGSEYLDFEIAQTPDRERCDRVRTLLGSVRARVVISARVAARAHALERFGFRGLDALHIAAAEAGQAELLITTDDRMARRAGRAGAALTLRVVRPADALTLLTDETKEEE